MKEGEEGRKREEPSNIFSFYILWEGGERVNSRRLQKKKREKESLSFSLNTLLTTHIT